MSTAEQTFPGAKESVAKVRDWAREHLRAWGTAPGPVEDALLVLSELSTNAIKHGRSGGPHGAFHVRLCRGSTRVRLEVTDAGGVTAPMVSRAGDLDPLACPVGCEGGRGLVLVEALAACWRVRGDTRSWTVTPDIDAGALEPAAHR